MEPATCGKLEDRRPRYGHMSHPDIKMEKKTTRSSLFLDFILIMFTLTWITEKELEREIQNKGEEFR